MHRSVCIIYHFFFYTGHWKHSRPVIMKLFIKLLILSAIIAHLVCVSNGCKPKRPSNPTRVVPRKPGRSRVDMSCNQNNWQYKGKAINSNLAYHTKQKNYITPTDCKYLCANQGQQYTKAPCNYWAFYKT